MLIFDVPGQEQHSPPFELQGGAFGPAYETPARQTSLAAVLRAAQVGDWLPVSPQPIARLARVHSADYLDFLSQAWGLWQARYPTSSMALPYAFPVAPLSIRAPQSIVGLLGRYSFDVGTPLLAGTWDLAKAAAQAALSAADALWAGAQAGLVLARPPGHHAAASLMGGYCYLNNAALAAQALLDHGAKRIAIVDVDYHHGNGTQSIFAARNDVFFASIHADPATDFPYFLGYGDECGVGAGEGHTLNLPLPRGSSWAEYAPALAQALARVKSYSPDVLIVSLGLDTAATDPIAHFRLEAQDFTRMGAALARLGMPTLLVLEGGYDVAGLSHYLLAFLHGFKGA